MIAVPKKFVCVAFWFLSLLYVDVVSASPQRGGDQTGVWRLCTWLSSCLCKENGSKQEADREAFVISAAPTVPIASADSGRTKCNSPTMRRNNGAASISYKERKERRAAVSKAVLFLSDDWKYDDPSLPPKSKQPKTEMVFQLPVIECGRSAIESLGRGEVNLCSKDIIGGFECECRYNGRMTINGEDKKTGVMIKGEEIKGESYFHIKKVVDVPGVFTLTVVFEKSDNIEFKLKSPEASIQTSMLESAVNPILAERGLSVGEQMITVGFFMQPKEEYENRKFELSIVFRPEGFGTEFINIKRVSLAFDGDDECGFQDEMQVYGLPKKEIRLNYDSLDENVLYSFDDKYKGYKFKGLHFHALNRKTLERRPLFGYDGISGGCWRFNRSDDFDVEKENRGDHVVVYHEGCQGTKNQKLSPM